jgi:hypothetical protein
MSKAHDLTGRRYGLITVIERDRTDQRKDARWICKCDCGTTKSLFAMQIKTGKTVSCGCQIASQARARALRHGLTKTSEHRSWSSMNSRCNNPNHHAYEQYGGRGIKICARWKSFELFLSDMGPRPSLSHTLDRINNDGDYEPGNCRWATKEEQRLNNSYVRIIEIDGVTRRLSEWARVSGIPFDVLSKRLNAGWDPKRAITQPRRITRRSHI